MKFLKLLLLLLPLSSVIYGQIPNQPVTIYGNIVGYQNQKIRINKIDKYENFRAAGDIAEIKPDPSGAFTINLNVSEPQYYTIGYNHVYLTPGEMLEIHLNMDYPDKTIYKGKSESIQNYLLNAEFPKSGSFLRGGRNVKKTRKETLKYILSMANERYAELAVLKDATDEFKFMESARIRADLINSLDFLIPFYRHAHKIAADTKNIEEQEFITQQITPGIENLAKDFMDWRYMELTIYRYIIPHLLKYNSGASTAVDQIEEWTRAQSIIDDIRRGKYESNPESKNVLKERISQLSNPEIVTEVNSFIAYRSEIRNGATATDIKFEHVGGEINSLSDYRGKIIYIDFWATWCGPCIAERQHFKKLSEQFSSNDIVFLALSTDDNKQAWLRFNGLFTADNIIEAKLSSDDKKKYNIAYIPRYILIDKDFKVIDLYAPKPSSEEIVKKIKQAINISNGLTFLKN